MVGLQAEVLVGMMEQTPREMALAKGGPLGARGVGTGLGFFVHEGNGEPRFCM